MITAQLSYTAAQIDAAIAKIDSLINSLIIAMRGTSEEEEVSFANNAEDELFAKIGPYGIKAKAYLDMQGNPINGVGDLPINKKSTDSEAEEVSFANNSETEIFAKVGPYGIKTKALLDLNGNPLIAKLPVPKINNLPPKFNGEYLRILDIGNSFTEDSTALVNLLAQNSTLDLTKIALWRCIRGSGSFKTWYDLYNNNDPVEYHIGGCCGSLSVIVNAQAISPTQYPANDGTAFRSILKDNIWDIVVIHQVSSYSGDYNDWEGHTEKGYLQELVRIVRVNQPQACIYFDLIHTTTPNVDTKWEATAESARSIAANYGLYIIPYGTAIQNLRQTTYNNDVQLTRDGHHLGYGLARYTAACAYFETLFAPRIEKSVYGNLARYTCSSSEKTDPTYPQSSIDVDNTNAPIAQLAAILACSDMYKVYNPQNITL